MMAILKMILFVGGILAFLVFLAHGQVAINNAPVAAPRIWLGNNILPHQIDVILSDYRDTNPTIIVSAANATKLMTIELATGKVTYTNCTGEEIARLFQEAHKPK